HTGVEQLHDVFPALPVSRTGDVGVRELVDDGDLWRTRDHRVDIHLLEGDAAILDSLTRHDLEVASLCFGVDATVRLDEADDDVDAAAPEVVRLIQHSVRLADAGGRADVHFQLSSFAVLNEGKEVVWARAGCGHRRFRAARRIIRV